MEEEDHRPVQGADPHTLREFFTIEVLTEAGEVHRDMGGQVPAFKKR